MMEQIYNRCLHTVPVHHHITIPLIVPSGLNKLRLILHFCQTPLFPARDVSNMSAHLSIAHAQSLYVSVCVSEEVHFRLNICSLACFDSTLCNSRYSVHLFYLFFLFLRLLLSKSVTAQGSWKLFLTQINNCVLNVLLVTFVHAWLSGGE